MSAVLERESPRPLSAQDLFEFWRRHSDEFMRWQRENFLQRRAMPDELQEHSKQLDLMIGLTLHIYSVASNTMPHMLRTITGRLRQLEDSRALIHNSMTDQKADEIANETLPDEPAIRRSA